MSNFLSTVGLVLSRGRDDAWELFSKYTHSEKNREWLKQYGLRPSRERSSYDY